MAIIGIRLDDTSEARAFAEYVRVKLSDENLLYNPFRGYIRELRPDAPGLLDLVISITPVYPRLYILGFIILAAAFIFTLGNPGFLVIPGIILSLPAVLYNGEFYRLVFRWGLKKKGYKGRVKRITKDDIVNHLFSIWKINP